MSLTSTTTKEIVIIAFFLVLVLVVTTLLKRRPRNLNTTYFTAKWRELQKLCATTSTWPLAVINADKLLDEALKKCRYKGKTMGERLVAAQHDLTDNDSVWFGHKLRNKLVHEHDIKLKKNDIKDALRGIRQALKDLKAL